MPAGRDIRIIAWPTELRFHVYTHIIVDCLRDGNASATSNLSRCCRTIRCEIQSEFMWVVRPLLFAQHQWITCPESQDGSLHITLDTPATFPPEKTTLHITVPLRFRRGLTADTSSRVKVLGPVFMESRWAELSLSFEDVRDDVKPPGMHMQAVAMWELVESLPRAIFSEPRIRRLVLDFHNPQEPADDRNWVAMFSTARIVWLSSGRTFGGQQKKMKCAWMSRVRRADRRGWRVTVDLEMIVDLSRARCGYCRMRETKYVQPACLAQLLKRRGNGSRARRDGLFSTGGWL